MDVGLVTVLRKNTAYFSSRELMTERVFYVHDDSETRRDSFHFVALSSEEEDFQYVGVFHVDVLLKNDNTPVRAVDKVRYENHYYLSIRYSFHCLSLIYAICLKETTYLK